MRYGQETIKFRTPSLWTNLPKEYKLVNSMNIFWRKSKNWKCKTSPCRSCQTCQKDTGSIWLYSFVYIFICFFICLLVCFFVLILLFILLSFYCLFHCFSDLSSVSRTVERMYEWIFNFWVQVVDANRSTINCENASHQLIKSSQRNTILFFLQYRK